MYGNITTRPFVQLIYTKRRGKSIGKYKAVTTERILYYNQVKFIKEQKDS
jgi:hypothetical protein